MRAILIAVLAAAAIGCYVPALSAAPAGIAAQPHATPLSHLAQYWSSGGWPYGTWGSDGWAYGSYRPACPWGYHFACRVGPYGYRHCACWPNY